MFMYLYTLTFHVFMTSVIRIPAPISFALPLIFFFREVKDTRFYYLREIFIFLIASIFLYLFAQENIKNFFVNMIICSGCALYFNYFVGNNLSRMKQSIWVFFSLLLVSSIIMLLNHVYTVEILMLRTALVGEVVKQTPSGITPWIFSYGYQIAALATFAVIAACTFKKPFIVQAVVFAAMMICIFYGMNRSALVAFSGAVCIFWLSYYRFKAVLLFSALFALAVFFQSSLSELSTGRKQNILAKNEMNANEHRSSLMVENLKIIADYPFGVAFYGKTWYDVAKHNPAFKIGEEGFITSHNAYLMFITYLGIALGGLFIWLMFKKVALIFFKTLWQVRKPENALKTALCFSLAAVCLNSFFHNEWILAGSGPTLFLYFGILQLDRIEKASDGETAELKIIKRKEANTSKINRETPGSISLDKELVIS